jgi:acetoin utilization deacetylase AcuC-like enzyme
MSDKIVFFYPQGHEKHSEPGHPERPQRVEAVQQGLAQAGWWDRYPKISPIEITERDILSIHSRDYLERLKRASSRGRHLDMDTYTTPASWDLAKQAAGGAIAVALAVWEGNAENGFALTRPPGHHARPGQGMGFCLLNNISLAADFLLQKRGAERIAIVDLDLHHGNGTEEIFWRRGDVLYISTHEFPFYPGTGDLTDRGEGQGYGYTANFPLPPGTGDQGFQEIMDIFILPLLNSYQPQMILVSFGFDPHWRDPLGHLKLTAEKYGELVRNLKQTAEDICRGKIALFLEGGYDIQAGAACGWAVTAAMLREAYEDPLGPPPRPEGKSWERVVQQARQIWEL